MVGFYFLVTVTRAVDSKTIGIFISWLPMVTVIVPVTDWVMSEVSDQSRTCADRCLTAGA